MLGGLGVALGVVMPGRFSEHIVFVDESGDHGLKTIDPNYPMFVLAFCIFRKVEYTTSLVPELKHFKFKHFGHDQVILHETDIRKDRGDFTILKTREKKEAFLNELSDIVEATSFTFVATAIQKEALLARYANPVNPYHVALGFGLEQGLFLSAGYWRIRTRFRGHNTDSLSVPGTSRNKRPRRIRRSLEPTGYPQSLILVVDF